MLKRFTKEERSWIFYDWANSAFSAIVSAIILPVFFKTIAGAQGVSDVDATAFWGYATSFGTLICAVLAPFLGTLGDFKGMKKKLFSCFLALGVISTFLLAMTNSWKMLLAFYILGTIGFSGSCIYYDSFLLDVTDTDRMDAAVCKDHRIPRQIGPDVPDGYLGRRKLGDSGIKVFLQQRDAGNGRGFMSGRLICAAIGGRTDLIDLAESVAVGFIGLKSAVKCNFRYIFSGAAQILQRTVDPEFVQIIDK